MLLCKPMYQKGQAVLQIEEKLLYEMQRAHWTDRIFHLCCLAKLSALSTYHPLRHRHFHALFISAQGFRLIWEKLGMNPSFSIIIGLSKTVHLKLDVIQICRKKVNILDSGEETKLSGSWRLLSTHVIPSNSSWFKAKQVSLDHFRQLFNIWFCSWNHLVNISVRQFKDVAFNGYISQSFTSS